MSKEGTKIAVGAIAIPLFPSRRREGAAETIRSKENFLMPTLSEEDKKIAAGFGMSDLEFVRAMARFSRSKEKETCGLTDEALAIARSFGMSPRAFASAHARLKGGSTAIAAGERREDKPGLLRAHDEVDRAHKADYEATGSIGDTSDREMLDAALAALKKYNPDADDDDNYDRLLTGVMYAMRLLNRVAPAYAEIKEIKK